MRALLLALLVGCGGEAEELPPAIVTYANGQTQVVEACAKGCSAPTPDETHPLSEDEALAHLDGMAAAPLGAVTEDLETLLFHRDVTLQTLLDHPGRLPVDHERFLREELARTRVEVAFRLVSDTGEILGHSVRTSPLKEKQHIILEDTGPLKHIEISGKTKRVGLHHLWSRW